MRVDYARDALTLRIDDDGPATGEDAGGSGNGLAGMRERAAALGGTIEAGPREDGGFRVLALLPLKGSGGASGVSGASEASGGASDSSEKSIKLKEDR